MDNIEERTLSDEDMAALDSMLEDIMSEEEENTQVEEPVTLRENSPTLLIDESQSRFSSAVWFDKISSSIICLGGLGGIGSWTSLLLSRLKPLSVYLYDDDKFELANMSGQLCGKSDIGQYKTGVAHNYAAHLSQYYNTISYPAKFTENTTGAKIMICGFDNMDARKTFYNVWKRRINATPDNVKKEYLFIDGRLHAEEFQILCISGYDEYRMKKYEEEWLFSDEEAEETICSYKQTSHMACMIASLIVNLFTNHIANQCDILVERDVPFFTYYNAETMYLKTES